MLPEICFLTETDQLDRFDILIECRSEIRLKFSVERGEKWCCEFLIFIWRAAFNALTEGLRCYSQWNTIHATMSNTDDWIHKHSV